MLCDWSTEVTYLHKQAPSYLQEDVIAGYQSAAAKVENAKLMPPVCFPNNSIVSFLVARHSLAEQMPSLHAAYAVIMGQSAIVDRDTLYNVFSAPGGDDVARSWFWHIDAIRCSIAGTPHADHFKLPAQLFSETLLGSSIGECLASGQGAVVAEALRATHGDIVTSRRTIAFKMALSLFSRFCIESIGVRWMPRANRPGIGYTLPATRTATLISAMYSHRRRLTSKFGIKLSDRGIVSAADAILHGYAFSNDSFASFEETALQLQSRLQVAAEWTHLAIAHQRCVEFERIQRGQQSVDLDHVFDWHHRGVRAIWERLATIDAGGALLINDDSELALPLLLVRRSETGLDIGVQNPRPEHAAPRRMTLRSDRTRVYNWTICRDDAPQSKHKLVGTLASNRLGESPITGIEYVMFWSLDAHDFDARGFDDEKTYDSSLMERSVENMEAMRFYFQPLRHRILQMLERIAAIPGTAECRRYVESISSLQGQHNKRTSVQWVRKRQRISEE